MTPKSWAWPQPWRPRRSYDRPLAITYYQRLYQLTRDPLVRRHLVELLISLNRFPEAIPLQEEEAAQFPENSGGPAPPGPAPLLAAGLPGGRRDLPAPAGEGGRRRGPAPGGGPQCRGGPTDSTRPWPTISGFTAATGARRNMPWPWPGSGPGRAIMPKPRASWPP